MDAPGFDGKEGAIVLVKIDGERDKNKYTVVLTGGRFGRELYFRKNGDDVTQLILEAANDYFGDE
ncbi:MAG TPA: hypothetical protein VHM91_00900 [Verrucomicrobiales bacterium]|nr:hypothetical protein [Verrucomicrobiales bacterium]